MRSFEYVTSAERLPAIAEEVFQAEVVSFDTETTGLSPIDSQIRLLSLNTGRGVYVIDAFKTQTLQPVLQAMANTKAIFVGQNAKFDQKFLLHHYGVELKFLFDTYRASALIYNGKFTGRGAHDLYALYSRELGIGPEAPDLGGSDWSLPDLSEEQKSYAAEDVVYLPILRDKLKPKLQRDGLNKVAYIEFQAILPEAAMELAGIYFDVDAWTKLAISNQERAEALRKELIFELPMPSKQIGLPGMEPDFNLQSSAHVLKSLQAMGLKTVNPDPDYPNDRKRDKLGPIQSTNEISLAGFKEAYPVVKKFLEYRGYAQAVKSFGIPYLENVNKRTGRIYTSYYPFTGAGRYASSQVNLQQVPRDKEFRSCFCAPPGKRIVGADYSQIELRLAAEIANDKALKGVYIRGEDAHKQTAGMVLGKSIEELTKGDRQLAKAVNFGLVYGMSSRKLVTYAQANYGVTMSEAQAKRFRDKYLDSYSGIHSWHSKALSEGSRALGMTRTIAGRLRYLPPTAFNEYLNSPVQGSGADGLKTSIRGVYELIRKYGDRAKMIHMVHDEILIEVDNDPDLLASVKKDLEDGMVAGMQPFLKDVPVVVEANVGDSWATAH